MSAPRFVSPMSAAVTGAIFAGEARQIWYASHGVGRRLPVRFKIPCAAIGVSGRRT